MLTVILDVALTRRKRAHIVVSPDGNTEFTSSRFSEVVDWFYEHDVSAFNVETEGGENFAMSLTTTRTALLGFAKDAAE